MCRSTSFQFKRTGKGKFIGVVTVGVGAVAVPKRLRCNGCGRNLLPALPDYKAERERRHQANLAMPEGSRLRKAAERNDAKTAAKVAAKAIKIELKMAKAEAKKAKKAAGKADETLTAPQGWYPDTADPTQVRWFDGAQWTNHVQPRH